MPIHILTGVIDPPHYHLYPIGNGLGQVCGHARGFCGPCGLQRPPSEPVWLRGSFASSQNNHYRQCRIEPCWATDRFSRERTRQCRVRGLRGNPEKNGGANADCSPQPPITLSRSNRSKRVAAHRKRALLRRSPRPEAGSTGKPFRHHEKPQKNGLKRSKLTLVRIRAKQ